MLHGVRTQDACMTGEVVLRSSKTPRPPCCPLFYILYESRLKDQKEITVPGYTWIGHNRLHLAPNAPHGSGGVGIR